MNWRKTLVIPLIVTSCLAFATPAISVNYDRDEQINITVYETINPAIVAIEAQIDNGERAVL